MERPIAAADAYRFGTTCERAVRPGTRPEGSGSLARLDEPAPGSLLMERSAVTVERRGEPGGSRG